jgi:hypothetical protein
MFDLFRDGVGNALDLSGGGADGQEGAVLGWVLCTDPGGGDVQVGLVGLRCDGVDLDVEQVAFCDVDGFHFLQKVMTNAAITLIVATAVGRTTQRQAFARTARLSGVLMWIKSSPSGGVSTRCSLGVVSRK